MLGDMREEKKLSHITPLSPIQFVINKISSVWSGILQKMEQYKYVSVTGEFITCM